MILINGAILCCLILSRKTLDMGVAFANILRSKITSYFTHLINILLIVIYADFIYEKTLLPTIKRRDMVAIHWNLAVKKLNNEEIENLEKYTSQNIEAINSLQSA